jgi:DNA-binding NarL/FixJ family response regulator
MSPAGTATAAQSVPDATRTRVLLVDDQELVRVGFRMILERGGHEVVGEAADGVEAVDLADALDPDVILMDVRMPRLDGIEATRRILESRPETKVVVLTTFDLDQYVYAAVRAGACGFLLKDTSPTELVRAVSVALHGEALLAPAVTRRLLERYASHSARQADLDAVAALSARQVEVLTQVARGRSNAEIGSVLHLSEATVKTYVSHLLARLDLRDRVQLTVFAYETGLVSPGRS